MSVVVVFASEVAAAIGKNPYRSPVHVLEDIWKRDDDYTKVQEEYVKSLDTLDIRRCDLTKPDRALLAVLENTQKVTQTAPTMSSGVSQSLKMCESALGKRKAQEISVVQHEATVLASKKLKSTPAEFIRHKEDSAKRIEQNTRFGQASQLLEEVLAKPPDQAIKRIQSHPIRPTTMSDDELRRKVTQTAQTMYGTRHESTAIAQFEEKHQVTVKDNNTICKSIRYPTFTIVGRVDGLVEGKLIEVKNRKSRFMTPLYDVIQIHCYMRMYHLECATLVQRLSDQTQESKITWDASLWDSEVVPKLTRFVEHYQRFLKNNRAKHEFIELPTDDHVRNQWWDKFIRAQD